MNDYISKPVDEKLLYSKMLDLLKKTKPLQATVMPQEISKMYRFDLFDRPHKS